MTSSWTPATVIGTITIVKSLDSDGRVMVNVEYDGLTSYEVVGLLTVELDTQRSALQADRGDLP